MGVHVGLCKRAVLSQFATIPIPIACLVLGLDTTHIIITVLSIIFQDQCGSNVSNFGIKVIKVSCYCRQNRLVLQHLLPRL